MSTMVCLGWNVQIWNDVYADSARAHNSQTKALETLSNRARSTKQTGSTRLDNSIVVSWPMVGWTTWFIHQTIELDSSARPSQTINKRRLSSEIEQKWISWQRVKQKQVFQCVPIVGNVYVLHRIAIVHRIECTGRYNSVGMRTASGIRVESMANGRVSITCQVVSGRGGSIRMLSDDWLCRLH